MRIRNGFTLIELLVVIAIIALLMAILMPGPRFTPYNEVLCSSDQLILRCPEQVGSDVVAEVTQVITERATRLVLFDKDGNRHESKGEIGGQGVGLVRHVHRFKNLDRSSIEHIEFQARLYEYWITLDNVSLHPGHETNVEVKVEKIGSLRQIPAGYV